MSTSYRRPVGFSTGSLAKGDFRKALEMLEPHDVGAVELSALREGEFQDLCAALLSRELNLDKYQYVYVHAPSSLTGGLTEEEVCNQLLKLDYLTVVARAVLHPDVITDWRLWKSLEGFVAIENMDRRKPTGKTLAELEETFKVFPFATLCLDLGHARQVDPTMWGAAQMLARQGNRISHVHLSEVDQDSKHLPLGPGAMKDFFKVAHRIPASTPIILETPVSTDEEIREELRKARALWGET